MHVPNFRTERAPIAGRIRQFCAVAGLALVLSACGGGGGGGGSTDTPNVGSVSVSVKDLRGYVVPGARVVASVASGSREGTTDASGNVTITGVTAGTGTLAVSRDTFKTKGVAINVVKSQTTNVAVALERDTKASGGVLSARTLAGGLGGDGKSLEFSIQVVVVDQASNATAGLQSAAFTLASCTPNAQTTTADCISGGPTDFDAAYVVAGPGPAPSFQEVPGGLAQPYAAALLFDQSESIRTNDPTDARLYSAREFLTRLGGADRASLSAMASGSVRIPEQPVTIYPVGNPSFAADGSFFLPMLDSLATLEGGGTPLYEALCRLIDFSATNAPAGLRKAVVLFADGENNPVGADVTCQTIDQVLTRSTATGVSIYTVGLSNDVDGAALAALADGGNGAFMFAEDTSQLVTIYGSLGNLLSGSLTTYKLTYRITTDVAGGFAAGRAVRGVVTVDTGAGIVTLPIVVRIF